MMKREKNVVYGPEPLKPLENFTAGQLLYNALLKHSHVPQAMVDVYANEVISYKTLFETTCQLAQSLERCGYKQNDVMNVCSENSTKFFIPVIAAWYLGIVVAPANEDYLVGELCKILSISNPQLVICSKRVLPKMLEVRKTITSIKRIIILDADEDMHGCECLSNFILRYSDESFRNFKPVQFDPVEQVAGILCSSGTTGIPKGVMQTHRNLCCRLIHASDPRVGQQIVPGVTILAYLPFFHAFGFSINLGYFMVGLRIIMLKRFEPEMFLKTIQDYECRSVTNVPATIVFLAKSPLVDKYDLSSLNELCCGAAPLPKDVADAAVKRLKLDGIRCGYGLTESTSANIHSLRHIFKPGSLGKLTPFMCAKVIDMSTGEALGPNVVGEICLKGGMIMKGYAGDLKATQEVIDEDGWLHSGDYGYYTEDEYFYIVDRHKELIKYKGYQVAPVELENILLKHPSIKDAAVIGVPDEMAGELPAAFVVKQHGKEVTEQEVYDFVTEHVSYSKFLRGGIRFIDVVPRNVTGKIMRKELLNLLMHNNSKL